MKKKKTYGQAEIFLSHELNHGHCLINKFSKS